MNESDQRVVKTRQQLKQSVFVLINEFDYDHLSVMQIVKHAKVGHKTFYRHYQDKDELVQELVYDLLTDVFSQRQPPKNPGDIKAMALLLLETVEKYSGFVLKIRHGIRMNQLIEMFQNLALSEIQLFETLTSKPPNNAEHPPKELKAFFFTASLVDLIYWWLENGKPCSKEVMSDYINQLVIDPLLGA